MATTLYTNFFHLDWLPLTISTNSLLTIPSLGYLTTPTKKQTQTKRKTITTKCLLAKQIQQTYPNRQNRSGKYHNIHIPKLTKAYCNTTKLRTMPFTNKRLHTKDIEDELSCHESAIEAAASVLHEMSSTSVEQGDKNKMDLILDKLEKLDLIPTHSSADIKSL